MSLDNLDSSFSFSLSSKVDKGPYPRAKSGAGGAGGSCKKVTVIYVEISTASLH